MTIFAQLEALLFYYGEPIEIAKLASLLNIAEEEAATQLDAWEKTLAENPERGLMLLRREKKVQLVTKPELKHIGETIVKDEFREQLTPAALETLSLVAYLGPMPRASIDYIRGVNSSFTLRSLVMRGLVERGDEKGTMFHYRVTEQFLTHMGLHSIAGLPEYERYRAILRDFEAQMQPSTETPPIPPLPPENSQNTQESGPIVPEPDVS